MGLKRKASEQHSGTKVHTIGPGTVITPEHLIRDSEVGARDPAGANDTIQLGRGFGEECNIGDWCKYVNIFIQVAARNIFDPILPTHTGWLEYAFCCIKADTAPPTGVNLGTSTLGDVCTKYLRHDCLMTGFVPVGALQPNGVALHIKIPKAKVKLTVGDEWILFLSARTASATETATDTFRVITSFIYRNYH